MDLQLTGPAFSVTIVGILAALSSTNTTALSRAFVFCAVTFFAMIVDQVERQKINHVVRRIFFDTQKY